MPTMKPDSKMAQLLGRIAPLASFDSDALLRIAIEIAGTKKQGTALLNRASKKEYLQRPVIVTPAARAEHERLMCQAGPKP